MNDGVEHQLQREIEIQTNVRYLSHHVACLLCISLTVRSVSLILKPIIDSSTILGTSISSGCTLFFMMQLGYILYWSLLRRVSCMGICRSCSDFQSLWQPRYGTDAVLGRLGRLVKGVLAFCECVVLLLRVVTYVHSRYLLCSYKCATYVYNPFSFSSSSSSLNHCSTFTARMSFIVTSSLRTCLWTTWGI